jgi:hypothetical protein
MPVTFRNLGQNVSSLTDDTVWYDPAWSPTAAQNANCTVSAAYPPTDFGDALMAVRQSPSGNDDYEGAPPTYGGIPEFNNQPNLVMLYGGAAYKNGAGMYQHGASMIAKITDFSGGTLQPMKPKWSPNCDKIAFLVWDQSGGVGPPSKTSVYMINLKDNRAGWATASLPVTSLTASGVYKIYDYTSKNSPAYFPNWSADGKLVSYSIDNTNTLDLTKLLDTHDNFVNSIYGGTDFDTYLEYIDDQPAALGGVTSPQIVGASTSTALMRNEFGLVQCPGGLTGSVCPADPPGSSNYSFTFVSQTAADSGNLRELTLSNVSTVMANGGLLFLDGVVTAVFPPGVVASDTVFWNTWPTQYCTGAAANQFAGGGAGNCPVDPTSDYIVNAGEAREFFPDGTNFSSYVRLIFHYCDNDAPGTAGYGFVDAGTEGNSSNFTWNSGTGKCEIGGVPTSGGTIDVNSLAVYNWDPTGAKWVKLEGTVDKTNKTITVFSTHFSRYDTFGFRVGGAPGVIVPLQMDNIHTYPNPWRTTDGVPLRFAADDVRSQSDVLINIKIYDIRGTLVANLTDLMPRARYDGSNPLVNNGITITEWNAVNMAGRPLASGVYVYYLQANDTANGTSVTTTGKFSVIR